MDPTTTTPPVTAPTTTTTPVTTVNTDPWVKDWLQSDGKINTKAYERLPDDIKHLKGSLERQPDADSLMRYVASLQHLAGQKGLMPLPKEGVPESTRLQRKQMVDELTGTPPKPEDYGFKKPDNFDQKLWDSTLGPYMVEASKIFHDGSVGKDTASKLIALQQRVITEQTQAQEAAWTKFQGENEAKINAGLKTMGMSYAEAKEAVGRVARTWNLDPDHSALKDASIFLGMVQAFKATSEDKFVKGDVADATGGGDEATALSIMRDKSNPLYAVYHNMGADGKTGTMNHPRHREVVERVNKLMENAARKKGSS